MAKELDLRIKEIIQRTSNVKSFRLEAKDRPDFQAGQFLMVTLGVSHQLTRPLSISSSPTEKDYIEFTKKITDSEFSKTLDSLKSGDRVKIKYPFGNFTLESQYRKIAFLSGGIGITPIRSIVKYAVDAKMDKDIVLIYGNQTIKDIAFKEDFDIMQKEQANFKLVHVLCEVESGCSAKEGYINNQLIKEEIPDYPERKFYICGPPLMVESMQKILIEELRVPINQIITENFKGY